MRYESNIIDALEEFGPSRAEFARREKMRRIAVAQMRRQAAMQMLRIKPVSRETGMEAIEPREMGTRLVYQTKHFGTKVTLPWLSIQR